MIVYGTTVVEAVGIRKASAGVERNGGGEGGGGSGIQAAGLSGEIWCATV